MNRIGTIQARLAHDLRQARSPRPRPRRSLRSIKAARLSASAILSLALFFSASGAALASSLDSSPRLVLDKSLRDFGEVFVGERPSQTFTVRNTGDVALVLSEKQAAPARPAAAVYSGAPFAPLRRIAPVAARAAPA